MTNKKKQRRQQKLIQVLCKLCKSFYSFFFLFFSGAVRNNRETWQLRGRPVKTIWRPGQRVPLSGTHCLPAIDSSTLFCSNFLCTPNLNLSSIFYFFREFFLSLSWFFFLLNVKFLQTVLTVYRSALVISADVCCRCWNCQQREKEGEWSPKFGFNFGTYLAKVWIKSFVDAAFLLRSVENFHKDGSSFSGTSCVSDARRRRDEEKKVIIFLSQAPMASWLASNQIELPNGKIKLCFIFVFLFGIWLLTAATFIFSWLQL